MCKMRFLDIDILGPICQLSLGQERSGEQHWKNTDSLWLHQCLVSIPAALAICGWAGRRLGFYSQLMITITIYIMVSISQAAATVWLNTRRGQITALPWNCISSHIWLCLQTNRGHGAIWQTDRWLISTWDRRLPYASSVRLTTAQYTTAVYISPI